MEFSELIRNRYSVRAYKPDPVEQEKLTAVLEAARLAPTASNRQPFQLFVIPTEGRQEELKRIYNKEWFVQAPLIICACGLPGEVWKGEHGRDYLGVDVAIAMDHLILAAANLGLGTCWIGAFDAGAAREILDVPETAMPLIFTPLGYSADTPKPKVRKSLDELVRYL
ncbi:MAG: nitroreductase family protein [Anaerolineales bacterium]|nr:nitroreductase family protein [Anaerolineales bacterium]